MALNAFWFFLIVVLFTGFFFLEGFDYGVGMLLPFLGKNDPERRLIIRYQDTHLFNTTIRENLLLARPGASEEELSRAAELAQLHRFVQTLPQGYDTPIGEQGLCLSGGERQRLAIACAFLKNAPILLLDEPTAHLDQETEQAVFEALRTLKRGRTTLLITHRSRGLELADTVCVLQAGHLCVAS